MKTFLSIFGAITLCIQPIMAQSIVVDGSTTVGPIAKAFAEYFMAVNPDINVTVSESGSGNGAKGLVNQTCDVAAMSRPMKDSEFGAAAGKGIQSKFDLFPLPVLLSCL